MATSAGRKVQGWIKAVDISNKAVLIVDSGGNDLFVEISGTNIENWVFGAQELLSVVPDERHWVEFGRLEDNTSQFYAEFL